jgi:hypothetical protein
MRGVQWSVAMTGTVWLVWKESVFEEGEEVTIGAILSSSTHACRKRTSLDRGLLVLVEKVFVEGIVLLVLSPRDVVGDSRFVIEESFLILITY